MTKMLLALSILLSLLGIYSCTDENTLDEESIDYSFFVAGHVYGHPQIDHLGIHPALRDYFPKLQESNSMKFGIFTGDIVRTALASQWDYVDAQIDTLGLPINFAAGNHDVIDRPLFESRYGSTYYSWKEGADLFVVLDPNLDSWNISGEQLTFLKELLAQKDYTENVFVFFHQLLWWSPNNQFKNLKLNSEQGRADSINFYYEVLPLFKQKDLPSYFFAGDVGAFPTGNEFMYYQEEDIHFIASGVGSNTRDNIIEVHRMKDNSIVLDLIALMVITRKHLES